MNSRKRRQVTAMTRAWIFFRDHFQLANQKARDAGRNLELALQHIHDVAGNRNTGTGTFRGAVQERLVHRRRLRSALSDLSRVSKTLDPLLYPDVAALLKMGRLNGNAEFHAFTLSVISVAEPLAEVFIAHGAEDNFIADLRAMLADFDACGDRRNRGLGAQISNNIALAEAVREGMRLVRVLDAIVSLTLKANPALLGEWKTVIRQERRLPKTPPPESVARPASEKTSPPPEATLPSVPTAASFAFAAVPLPPDHPKVLPENPPPDF